MGKFSHKVARPGKSVIRKPARGISVLALACMAGLTGAARADEELLRFERVVAQRQVQAAEAGGGQVAGEAPAGALSSSAQVLQAVRESLAPAAPSPRQPEPVLEFSRLPGSMLPASEPLQSVGVDGAEKPATAAPAPAPLQVDWAALALPAAGAVAEVPASPSEGELRDLFLTLVEAAAVRSPAVKRALAERAASEAEVSEAKGQRYPQVQLGAQGASWQSGGGNRDNGTSLVLDVTTPVFDWGRIRRTVESRRHMVNAAESALTAELETAAYDVSANLVELGKQRIIVSLGQRYVDRMSELVKMLEGIVAVDAGRVSELTQARARLLQAEAARSTAEAKARDIEINLRKLVGERPLPSLPESNQWHLGSPDLQWLLAESTNHPVVQQARAQARSADTQADAVRSSLLPQVNWVVSKSTADDAYGRESAWHTGLTLSWSAFRGGSGRAAERAARMRAEAGWMNAEQQVQDLEYRIRAGNQDARALADRADLYRGLSIESNKVREAFYEQWYHLGRRTLLDVLSSETEHYSNQVGEVSNRFDGYQAVLRQYASAGALMRWLTAEQQ